MNRSEFFISAGIIFYLFVSLNYPILDVLVNPVKAANSDLEPHYNLKSQDLLLDATIKTHKWKIHSSKSSTKQSSAPATRQAFPKPSSPVSSKPLTDRKPPLTIHVVKPGDTLWKISAKYGVRGSTICKLNDLKGNDVLSVGMKLQVLGETINN